MSNFKRENSTSTSKEDQYMMDSSSYSDIAESASPPPIVTASSSHVSSTRYRGVDKKKGVASVAGGGASAAATTTAAAALKQEDKDELDKTAAFAKKLDSPHSKNGVRETGFIEKILHSYGFIQCVDRDARLFFHFTEYSSEISEMKVGDSVEFQMSFDRRNGKPVAVYIVKMDDRIIVKNGSVNIEDEQLKENKVTGKVVRISNERRIYKDESCDKPMAGQVCYEQSGEMFYLPFKQADIHRNTRLDVGDCVSFHIITVDKALSAHRITLMSKSESAMNMLKDAGKDKQQQQRKQQQQQPIISASKSSLASASLSLSLSSTSSNNTYTNSGTPTPSTPLALRSNSMSAFAKPVGKDDDLEDDCDIKEFSGVICCLKDHFGFIERSDIVKELFFHYTELKALTADDLKIGDDVTYNIMMRNNKEVATNVVVVESGTVIFEDIANDVRRGKINKLLTTVAFSQRNSNPLSGLIIYQTIDGPIEISYGDKDQIGNYTMHIGDSVNFNVATDRRDNLQRATNIRINNDTFDDSNEIRNIGYVNNMRDSFGFLECGELNMRIFFHFDEVIDSIPVRKGDEYEFTQHFEESSTGKKKVATRMIAIRKGSVQYNRVLPQRMEGIIERAAQMPATGICRKNLELGSIAFYQSDEKHRGAYSCTVINGSVPVSGDRVSFQYCETKLPGSKRRISCVMKNENRFGSPSDTDELKFGFIATIKENFGFIENETHDQEIYFNFSNVVGDTTALELGDEVEYRILMRKGKQCAECIKVLIKGTVSPEEILPEVYKGVVTRPLRIVDPEQEHYAGIISTDDDHQYQYGITSLVEKRDYIQTGDKVTFKLSRVISTGIERACCISTERTVERAKIDMIKGAYGFLRFEVESNKKLFFHLSEFLPTRTNGIVDTINVSEGDLVEFVVVKNQRNNKYSACQLRKLSSSTYERSRPERLLRLKSMGDELPSKTMITHRQPRGPVTGSGFTFSRSISCPVPCAIKESVASSPDALYALQSPIILEESTDKRLIMSSKSIGEEEDAMMETPVVSAAAAAVSTNSE